MNTPLLSEKCQSATPDTPPPPAPDAVASSPPPTAVPASPAAIELGVLGKIDQLTETETAELQTCEAIVGMGWQSFVEVGLALGRVRDARLYRADFPTFEDYCQVKWEYRRRYIYHLISAAQLFTHLCANSAHPRPESETHVRPLVGLPLEQAKAAWARAVELARGEPITARLVKKGVTRQEIARLFRTTPGRVAMIEQRAATEQAQAEQRGQLQAEPRLADDHVLEIALTNNYQRDARDIFKKITEGQPRIDSRLSLQYTGCRRAFPCWDEPGVKTRSPALSGRLNSRKRGQKNGLRPPSNDIAKSPTAHTSRACPGPTPPKQLFIKGGEGSSTRESTGRSVTRRLAIRSRSISYR